VEPTPPPGQVLTLPPRLQNQQPRPAAQERAPERTPERRTERPAPRPAPAKPAAQAPAPRAPAQPPVIRAPQQTGRPAPANRARAGAAAAAGAAAGAAATAAPAAPPPVEPPADATPNVGSVTGLPVPRFVALRSDEVNLRIGPDTRFPIEWTYQRRDLPVEVLREFNQWRRIRDMEGTEGWVHQSTLAGRRTMVVVGQQQRELRSSASAESSIVAHLMPGVVGRIRRCPADSAWCEVRIGDQSGWLRRGEIWGVSSSEEIN
jgi:SH3-like domain-containing protein